MQASSIMSLYEKAWQVVKSRIARAAEEVGRDPAAIRLLAVSKEQPAAAIRAAYALGQRAFGENYVQETVAKAAALSDLPDIEWHLIGPLQSNKARAAAQAFAWVHTIDRARIAERRPAGAGHARPPIEICVQVNISGEASKSGVAPQDALALLAAVAALPRLRLRGLMGIAEPTPDQRVQRAQYRRLRELFEAGRAAG